MQVVILCSSAQKSELTGGTAEPAAGVVWIDEPAQFSESTGAGCFIDLLFDNTPERISTLSALLPGLVVVHSVSETCARLGASFVRVNGWNTFLSSSIVEAACLDEGKKAGVEVAFGLLQKGIEWIDDIPGFITPRIVSAIINEAYYALEDGVSTKAEIDVAMKLGTAYPYGPFDWAQRIGLNNIVTLLQQLAIEQPRYAPCSLLVAEAKHTT
ncbi:MAG TPA: 3-hydroxyacyl-CoA dehydrogenase family protein [Flavisolibacter sp.]